MALSESFSNQLISVLNIHEKETWLLRYLNSYRVQRCVMFDHHVYQSGGLGGCYDSSGVILPWLEKSWIKIIQLNRDQSSTPCLMTREGIFPLHSSSFSIKSPFNHYKIRLNHLISTPALLCKAKPSDAELLEELQKESEAFWADGEPFVEWFIT